MMGAVDLSVGRPISDAEANSRWAAWSPVDVAERLATVRAPWCITAGWALELFTDDAARDHSDVEIGVPAHRFGEISLALDGYEWDVVGDGRLWPYPDHLDSHFQTWLRDDAGTYRLDVFREPHAGDHWVYRRNPAISLPYDVMIRHTSDGVPYSTPEVVFLFKAKHCRAQDELDFRRVLPHLDQAMRSRLQSWLRLVHPGHHWIGILDASL
ncbi:hypothetical protein CH299_10500 [Rhodococcus sp. 14-2686-1-2]|nr:hypothetical protein CH301_09950 [Rhodococcus sp. 15-1189-1-1a]OZF15763.1 hypothetical protein CH299_10500 [Rhodococcus sp. 14-2686-1-2]